MRKMNLRKMREVMPNKLLKIQQPKETKRRRRKGETRKRRIRLIKRMKQPIKIKQINKQKNNKKLDLSKGRAISLLLKIRRRTIWNF